MMNRFSLFLIVLIRRNLLSLDCEMVETEGKRDEVARVSLVSTKGVLLDEFVLPEGKITDYRTQYSGITAEHLASCKNSPSFCHFSLQPSNRSSSASSRK